VPRNPLELEVDLHELVVMDDDGEVDEELLPELAEDDLRALLRAMLLSRRFDERRLKLQRQGRIGTFAPAIGQEAAQLGAAHAMDDDDWLVPSYRETAMLLWRGTPMWGLLLYDGGYNEGSEPPEDHRNLTIAVPVGSQIPHAVGLAHAARHRGTGEAVLTGFGDGATSEGDFHEGANWAAVHGCPVVLLCQNNQYAITTPVELQTGSRTIAQKAAAYGIPGVRVDGNDLFAVYVATREALERARGGDGPTLIEAVTYRLSVHTTADDPSAYRDDEEVERWQEKDPIERLQRYLVDHEVMKESDRDELEEEVAAEVDDGWEEADRRMQELGDDPAVIFDHVYAELPPTLHAQREELTGQREGDGG
jgi:pyruvate dehydrogenase E1 component alpha subunit